MTFRIERALKARQDLLEIWQGVAIHDPEAANRQLSRIEDAIAALADFPHIGAPKEDVLAGSRTILKSPHLVFYRVFEAERLVQILRVLDGRRDMKPLFLE